MPAKDAFPHLHTRSQLFLAAPEGQPRLLLDTEDRLYVKGWSPSADALLVESFSYKSGLGKSAVLFVDDSHAPHLEVESHRATDATWSPDGSWVAFVQVDTLRETASVLIGSPGGTDTRILAGLGHAVRFRGWTPDGSAVLVGHMPLYWWDRPGATWYVPIGAGATVQVGDQPVEYPRYSGAEGIWKPPLGDELVYVAGGDVHIFRRGSWESRQLTSTGDYMSASWSPDGEYIIATGRLVDPEAGEVSPIPDVAPYATVASPPGGQLIAYTEAADEPRPTSQGTLLLDVQAGTVTRLTGPDEGYDFRRRWTPDGSRLLIWRSVCTGCDAATGKVLIVDVSTAQEIEVTDGFEHGAFYALSPDGNRLLVTGTRLRLVSLDGTVLREIPPPEGFEVSQALWSPDGARFVYVLRPVGYSDV